MTMYAEERQQAMAQLVAERGRLSVNVLAERYDVTTETVRRDLSALERLGLVRRVHGGAVPADTLAVIESGLVMGDSIVTDGQSRLTANAEVTVVDGPETMLSAEPLRKRTQGSAGR